jgi:hypothetical protein
MKPEVAAPRAAQNWQLMTLFLWCAHRHSHTMAGTTGNETGIDFSSPWKTSVTTPTLQKGGKDKPGER